MDGLFLGDAICAEVKLKVVITLRIGFRLSKGEQDTKHC
jgi:hypothetical protein